MNIHLSIAPVLLLIYNPSVGEDLVIGKPDSVLRENLISEHFLQFIVDSIRLKILIFNFSLDIFLLIGLVVIFFISTLLDI